MERFLIALDCHSECLKIVDYMARVLKGAQQCQFEMLHILPTTSPDKLRMDEVQRIEHIHAARPALAGYFWKEEDEKIMTNCFIQAREKLLRAGFSHESVSSSFAVESRDRADIIVAKAAELRCSTIVLGRRRLSMVKEFLIGSVSVSVIKAARGPAVWVIEI
jgi:nucleotide-binding universal stress UspA family protein